MNPADDKVSCACADFDDHDGDNPETLGQAKTFYAYLESKGYEPLMEISQSGTGAHVWLLFTSPIDAAHIRNYLSVALDECLCSGVEIYPRQDSVQNLSGRLGNFVRYPLWGQSYFTDLSLEPQEPLQCLQKVNRTDPSDIPLVEPQRASQSFSGFQTEGLPDRVLDLLNREPSSLLARRWNCDVSGMRGDGSRSTLAQAIATELVRFIVPTPEIEATLRYWCDKHDYQKADAWFHRTVVNAYNYGTEHKKRDVDTSQLLSSVLHMGVDTLVQGLPTIPTGIETIDASLKGIALGEFGIICGYPSMGKTALLFHWLEHAANIGFGAEYISLEMSALATTCRFLPRMGIRPEDVPDMSVFEVHEKIDEWQRLKKAPLYFSDATDTGSDLTTICDHIEDSARRKGVQLFAIDYAELVNADGNEFEAQKQVFRTLPKLSRKLNVAIILLAQMKKPDGNKPLSAPSLHAIKYGGAQEADMAIGCRWYFMENPAQDRNLYGIYGLKNKNRGIKQPYMEINFHPEQQSYSDREQYDQQPAEPSPPF